MNGNDKEEPMDLKMDKWKLSNLKNRKNKKIETKIPITAPQEITEQYQMV